MLSGSKQRERYKAGLFVMASVIVLAVTLALLAGWRPGHPVVYHVVFTSSVAGLQKHSKVTYNGVDVGKIEDIALDGKPPDKVRVTIGIDKRIPEGTRAIKQMAGLTGMCYLELSPPEDVATQALLEPGSTITGELGQAEQLLSHVHDVLDQITRLIAANQRAVNGTLKEMEATMRALREVLHTLRRFLQGQERRHAR